MSEEETKKADETEVAGSKYKLANNKRAGNKRHRTTFNPTQVQILEKIFQRTHYPDSFVREDLARQVCLSETRVQVGLILYIDDF
jgi:hypothetical protein